MFPYLFSVGSEANVKQCVLFVLGRPAVYLLFISIIRNETCTFRISYNIYVNGKKYDKSYLTYEDVQAGITLHFVMSGKPNYKRAVSVDARPASLSSPGKTMFYQISDSK